MMSLFSAYHIIESDNIVVDNQTTVDEFITN